MHRKRDQIARLIQFRYFVRFRMILMNGDLFASRPSIGSGWWFVIVAHESYRSVKVSYLNQIITSNGVGISFWKRNGVEYSVDMA